MTEPQKFFKVDDTTIYHDGFSYSFYRDLDPPKSSADLQLHQSFHCALRTQEENCRSRIQVTGNWEMDKKGSKFMLGIVKKRDHTHGREYRDTTRKLRFYKNDDGNIHRNGFVYSLYREMDPPKQIEDFQCHQSYRCSMSVNGQENCRARIYTTGQWEKNKRNLQYQLGIFKNCIHRHESVKDPRIASRRSSTVPNASTNGRDRSIEDIQADREQSLSALYRKAEDRIGKTKVQSPKKSKEKRPTGALTSTTPEGSPLKEEGSQMASGQMSEPNGPTARELSAFLEDVHRGNFPTTIGINAVSERTVAPFNRYVGTAHYPKGVNNNQCASNDNSVLSTDIIDEALDQALEVRIVSNKAAAPAPVQAPVQIQAATVSDSDDDIECVGYQPGINVPRPCPPPPPLRRSIRKTARAIEEEKRSNLQQLIKTGANEKYLQIYKSEEKGRGICALKPFEKDEFVIEYKGDIISYKMAKIREEEYAQDSKIGSYMYSFKHHDHNYCVDATEETPDKGRLINHSVLKPNLKTKVVDFGKSFHLVLNAKRDIDKGEELLYDYGDRTACTVAKNPWLLNS